ncbi:hypothetical protein [Flavobacterium sp.]|uniref:hypothetical protein n=1 Tax=Flavobacterium sp. TaxID=239 RepID=UPI0039E3305E
MFIFRRLFKKPDTECPRCLGKGTVDADDIKRLGKELGWLPGQCAFCNGSGKVFQDTVAAVPADLAYLTTSLSKIERSRILNGDKKALERARIYAENLAEITNRVAKQYYVGGLDLETISDLHFARFYPNEPSQQEKEEFLEFAAKIIAFYKDQYE